MSRPCWVLSVKGMSRHRLSLRGLFLHPELSTEEDSDAYAFGAGSMMWMGMGEVNPDPPYSVDLGNRNSSPCDRGQAGQANPSLCVSDLQVTVHATGQAPLPQCPPASSVSSSRDLTTGSSTNTGCCLCVLCTTPEQPRREGRLGEETPRLTFVFKNGDGAYPNNNSEIPRGCLACWVGHVGCAL